jgi:alkylation response protein AidB-like acyl-CoA dehydrogenase
MSLFFLRSPGPAAPRPDAGDSQLPIDTSKLSEGQRQALEVAEAARDATDGRAGFAAELLMGRYRPRRLQPFPRQSDEDRAEGDALVGSVSALLAERLDAEAVDESRAIPQDVVEGLRDLGVFRMKVPREHGGLGLSQVNYNRVIMAIASHCGSTAVLVSAHQSIGVPQPLKMFGTDEQKQRFFPRLVAGELSAFALTEPEVGSDPARMTTTAELTEDGREYVLNGEKLWTTNGPVAGLLVVMARTAPKMVRGKPRPQITALIVDGSSPGVEAAHRCDFMGLRAIQNGLLRFTDVRVPAENVLWGEGLGLKLALRTLNTGRLTLPAACTGLGKQCLAIARAWGNERVQWGQPIGRHEAGRDKIARIAATTFAMEAVTWLTSHWADQGRDIRIEAAMAKLFCSEAAWTIVDSTMQLRGGRGYERASSLAARGETPVPVERMMRDTRINTIIEGTSDIMRLFLAREALDPHLSVAGELLRPGTALPRKAVAFARTAGFYGRWYPVRVVGGRLPRRFGELGPLARHGRFIDRNANRLAATLFRAMVRHGPRLERRQLLLGRLMDVGTELFAMSAACAYARSGAAGDAAALADVFCRQARRRIDGHFRAMRAPARAANRLAADVLEGRLQWLERGVIEGPWAGPAGDEAPRGA